MPDEDLTTDDEQEQEQEPEKKPARSDNRFKDLSEKVEMTAKERDEANAAKASAEKELEFYKGFSKVSSKPEYAAASDYQEKIKEKFNSGYELEDATISVLGKAGKLNVPITPRESPMGGSATNTMSGGGDKPVADMSLAEKREALEQMERESPGNLAQILRRTNL